jgi:hypothetical protein
MKFKQYKSICISHYVYGHRERETLSTGEVVTIKSLDESNSFCTCPRAETRLTVYRSPLGSGRACICENRCVFSNDDKFSEENELVNIKS